MFHKIKFVAYVPDYKLSVQFAEGVTKIYDLKDINKYVINKFDDLEKSLKQYDQEIEGNVKGRL